MRIWLAWLVAASFLVATPAWACVICLPYPQKTSADRIIESGTVVLARENPARPFTYEPVETVKGRYDGSPIPLLLDSTTARALRLDPNLTVALVEDRPGDWTKLGIAGTEYQRVIRAVAGWRANNRTPTERADFFASYLRNPEDGLAELAFLEIGRAPYATVRQLSAKVPREKIYRTINDWFRVEWHPLYVLMLGTSDRPDDLAFVKGKVEAAAEYGLTINLGAYATAFIEMVGTDAVRQLAETYFLSPSRNADELREIVKALSVHGNGGRTELRPAIIAAYADLITHHPELSHYVAADLTTWRARGLAPRMREILNAGLGVDEEAELAITIYLLSAEDRPGNEAAAAIPSGRMQ